MAKKTGDKQSMKFRFDISAYRLIGRELITDRITALFEIVKNSYDANANKVEIRFEGEAANQAPSRIVISDDGIGMNLDDLKRRWMVIGTSSKRRDKVSPKPYSRKVVGKKGIGRFAVDLLGGKLTLKTKKRNESVWVCLETDWSTYSKLESKQLSLPFEKVNTYFTDVENKYWYETTDDLASHGTSLQIEYLNNAWTLADIRRVTKELAKLVSPSAVPVEYPFSITLCSPYEKYDNHDIKPLEIPEVSTLCINLKYDKESKKQEFKVFDQGEFKTIQIDPKEFGPINLKLYYFDQQAKRKFKEITHLDIDGVKIYRDGIITTPFAETEENIEKQKDILGLDKRRYSGFFEKLNTRDLMGIVEITEELNPNIREATNRQDFIDNSEWRALKAFIIEQIKEIEKWLKYEKEKASIAVKRDLGEANESLKSLRLMLSNTIKNAPPELQKPLRTMEIEVGKLQGSVSKGIREYAKLEEETKHKEELFFSLVSLQTYAAMLSHMTKHTIGHILRDAEYFKDHYPNPELEHRFLRISQRIYSEMINLRTGVDYMLRYAQSDSKFEKINLYDLIHGLLFGIYAHEFEANKTLVELDLNRTLVLNYNRKALEDVFDNLISNSIKAIKGNPMGRIKCSGYADNNELVLLFSDNGIGIPTENWKRVFEIFFTTTGDDGGAGIGLYMVKTRIEAMKGSVEIVDPEFQEGGATFRIVLPFNKSNNVKK